MITKNTMDSTRELHQTSTSANPERMKRVNLPPRAWLPSSCWYYFAMPKKPTQKCRLKPGRCIPGEKFKNRGGVFRKNPILNNQRINSRVKKHQGGGKNPSKM